MGKMQATAKIQINHPSGDINRGDVVIVESANVETEGELRYIPLVTLSKEGKEFVVTLDAFIALFEEVK